MIPPSHSLAIAFALLASTSAGKTAAVLAFAPSLPHSRTNALEPHAAARNGKSAGGRRGDGDMDVDDVIGGKKGVDDNPARRAALEGVLQRIERNYGRGSIVKLGDAGGMVVDCVGSGSMTLGE